MADFGTGLDVIFDWPRTFTYASGQLNLGNNLCRRLQTPRGSLSWDPDCGWDVRALFRGSFTVAEINAAEAAISAECEKDERVDSATASLTYIPQAQTLVISIQITGADGPFVLVLSVDAFTVSILKVVAQ
jgi:hypothetical protein